MTLITRVQEATGLSAETAAKAVGSLLAALRLSLDAKSFEPIAKAVPDYNELMSGSGAVLGGRTGEIFAVRSELRTAMGAGHLAKELTKHGVPADKLAAFAGAFLGQVQDSAGPEAVGQLREALPGLAALFD
ncbi:MAG: hypothetical protein ABJB33_08005 [Gemmatimonadota bacterium]